VEFSYDERGTWNVMTIGPVLHWFDFICPFCYIAQDRNRILRHAGVAVLDLPLQIHPEIGPGGAAGPARVGPMYEQLAAAAGEAGLELTWSSRVAYSRPALVAAERVRVIQNDRIRHSLPRSSTPTSHSPRTLKRPW
jgi:hypothetical protein